MAEQILVDPQDRVSGAQLRWSGAELHLVDDDAMHPRRRRRGDEQGDGGYRERTGYRAHHRRLAARCSACIWCWLNSVSPVSRSDFSSLFVADGISTSPTDRKSGVSGRSVEAMGRLG